MTQAEFNAAQKQSQESITRINRQVRKEIAHIYINAADEIAKEIETLKVKGNGKSLTSASLKALEKSLRNTGARIAAQVEETIIDSIDNGISKTRKPHETYIKDALDAAKIDKIDYKVIEGLYTQINVDLIELTYTRVWADGYTFSNKIWGYPGTPGQPYLPGLAKYWENNVKDLVLSGLAQGRDILDIAKDLSVYAVKGKKGVMKRYGDLVAGSSKFRKRIPKNIDWRAMRLARSELYISLQDASKLQGRLNPATLAYIWHLTGGVSHDNCICPDLAADSPYLEGEVPDFPHPNCYKDGTLVYTNCGWKDFKSLTGEELFLSLNPKTNNYEWSRCMNIHSYAINSELVEIKSRWFEMITTKDHMNYVKASNKFRWLTSFEIHNDKYSIIGIPRFGEWKGKKIKNIKIGNFLLNTNQYCEFMGYYLSEGNISKYTKQKGHFGTISQQEGIKKNKMWDLFKKLPFKIMKSKIGFYFGDESVCLYLKQFGNRSWLKKAPVIIKKMEGDMISIFLNAFILGDGSSREIEKEYINNKIKNIKSKSKMLFTSSNKLKDDMGELIIKAGGYPSFIKMKVKTIKFKNGTYTTKHPCWRIAWNKSKFAFKHSGEPAKGLKTKIIKYKGYVHDVALEKNHILWIQYNGKTFFSGNCLCYITQKIRGRKEFVNDLIDWGKGIGVPYLDNWYSNVYLAG